ISCSVNHLIGTPTTKNINKPTTMEEIVGMIIIGISPSAHFGIFQVFLIHNTKYPIRYPPTIPPKKPAPSALAIKPIKKPGAIPGRSAMEYAIYPDIKGANNPIPNTPKLVNELAIEKG